MESEKWKSENQICGFKKIIRGDLDLKKSSHDKIIFDFLNRAIYAIAFIAA